MEQVALEVQGAMVKAPSSMCRVPEIGMSQSMEVNPCNILSKAVTDSTHQIFVSAQPLRTNHWVP